MKHTREVLTPVVTGFTCDRCALVTDAESLDFQEALHIDFVGGYSSVFGDGTRVRCDLCQDCLHTLIKDHCLTSRAA